MRERQGKRYRETGIKIQRQSQSGRGKEEGRDRGVELEMYIQDFYALLLKPTMLALMLPDF